MLEVRKPCLPPPTVGPWADHSATLSLRASGVLMERLNEAEETVVLSVRTPGQAPRGSGGPVPGGGHRIVSEHRGLFTRERCGRVGGMRVKQGKAPAWTGGCWGRPLTVHGRGATRPGAPSGAAAPSARAGDGRLPRSGPLGQAQNSG